MRASLEPPITLSDYPFVHRIRTRFAETDAMGVIHHGAYAAYLEEARAELLRHLAHPYGEVRVGGVDFAVLELVIRYRKPLRFDDLVDIGVMVGALTRATFQVAYLVEVAGMVCSTAVSVHGAVTPDGRPTRMPAWLAHLVDPPAG
ncbi:MAG: acyl-CoA thioesterase [Acidimicrobiales bacterium]